MSEVHLYTRTQADLFFESHPGMRRVTLVNDEGEPVVARLDAAPADATVIRPESTWFYHHRETGPCSTQKFTGLYRTPCMSP